MLVRTDLTLPQQIVQVGHVCLEAGRQFKWPTEPCNLVVLAVRSQTELVIRVQEAEFAGIRTALFHEPDDNLGATACCTEPLTEMDRRLFRRLPLWRVEMAATPARGPPVPAITKRV